MSEIFGTKYFGFIASSFAVTFAVLALMVIWVLMTYSKRKRELARLENAGLKRASSKTGASKS
ncbi:MAG: heme exporter protein CcmD [Rhizobiaceae bacterium]